MEIEADIVKETGTKVEVDMGVRIGSFSSIGYLDLLFGIIDLVDEIGIDSGR